MSSGGKRPGAGRKAGGGKPVTFYLSVTARGVIAAIPAGKRSEFVEAAIQARGKKHQPDNKHA